MALVIVTDRLFVKADRINSMNLSEEVRYVTKGKKDVCEKYYQLCIEYEIDSNGHPQHNQVAFSLHSSKSAEAVFKEVVRQYRDQNPDELYLDKMVEELLK